MSDPEGNPGPLIAEWTTFPPELFETILAYLDLDSVKALRLTDRTFAEKCIGPRFLSSIQQPILDVSLQNLRSLHTLACNPVFSKMIHSMTFLATSLDSSEAEKNVESGKQTVREIHGKSNLKWPKGQQRARAKESSSEMIELLQGALKRLRGLHFIKLDSTLLIGPTERVSASEINWHPLWMRASHVLFFIVTGLVQSGVSVKKFNAYRQAP